MATGSDGCAIPPSLLPELLELEGRSPAEYIAFFADALDRVDSPTAGANAVREVLRHAAKAGLEASALEAEVRRAGLSDGLSAAFAQCWAVPVNRQAVLAQAFPVHTLVDLDWTFGVSASSSEHAAMGTTYVQLRPRTEDEGGAPQCVHTELNLSKFYELLHELELAKSQLELC